ncbi:MAG: hypothetical protein DMD79_02615 [Candidatus Rokuibacteriota bacterium]|nr:MAG: hypothetical protein DMD79_02615 [Candidatus Rokubacteria bacterium]
MADERILASRCERCARVTAPPARFCPDDGTPMGPTSLARYGEVISFTTLHSPPTGFSSPLHLALVELDEGAKFFCHGADTRGLRLGARVATLSLVERAGLFWRRRGARVGERLSSVAKSAAKRLIRRSG